MDAIKLSYDKKSIEEKKQIYAMYQEIFEDPERFADYYFEYMYPSNRVLKLLKENELAAMLHLNPYTLRWNGQELPVSYIVAVATYERYRRQGMMAKLLQKAFEDLYKEGQLFTYLIPANEAYYTPFDFTYVMNWQEAEIERKSVPVNRSYQVVKIDVSLYSEAAAFLNRKREDAFDLWIQVDEDYIRKQDAEMQSEDGGLYFLWKEGCPEGFFSATVDEEALYCTNLWIPATISREELEETLFACFQKERAELVFQGKNPFANLSCRYTPKIMVRIICLEKFLERMQAEQEDSLILEVEDICLPENNGCFCWHIDKEGSRVQKTTQQPEWKVKIRQLTGILFGYGEWEKEMADASAHVKTFFHKLHKLKNISITEQV